MKKISRDTRFSIFIGATLIIANSWHMLKEWRANGPDEVFTGISHYFIDYFFYISHIVQGANGAWIYTRHMFTNEPLPPTWIYWPYTILGKFSTLGVDPFVVYNVSIVVFAAILFILWWRILGTVLPEKPFVRICAFLFISSASNFPGLGDFWFSPTPALNRLGGVPHQLFQSILLLLVIILFSESVAPKHRHARFPRTALYILLALISFVAATASPIQMLLVVTAASIYLIISLRSDALLPQLFSATLLSLPALLGAYLTNTEFARQQILVVAKLWESNQHVSVSLWQFILAVGPISLFIPFGIRPYVHKLSPLRILLGIFSVLSIAAFFSPLPKLLGTAPVRWLSPASYGALPILAALGLPEIARFIRHAVFRKTPSLHATYLLLVFYLLVTIPSLMEQIQTRSAPLETDRVIRSLNHISFPMIDAFIVMQNNTDDRVVLTDPALLIDTVIPIFTGHRSFTGQPVHTLFPQTKEQLRQRFFAGDMTEIEANQFIIDHDIGYILVSRSVTRILHAYTFMTRVFQNDVAHVYVIQPK